MIKKIISGGQTGADQGGLAAAVKLGLDTGGWIPKNYRTEAGSNLSLSKLGLKEHTSSAYPPRTRLNVRDSDGTLVFGYPKSRGTVLTTTLAEDMRKPFIVIEWKKGQPMPQEHQRFREWVTSNNIETLNVAGNRESRQPGIFQMVCNFIIESIGETDG